VELDKIPSNVVTVEVGWTVGAGLEFAFPESSAASSIEDG
jgi:hypothetical protein